MSICCIYSSACKVDLWTRLFRHITTLLIEDGNKSIFLSFVFVFLFVLSKSLTMDNIQKLSDCGCYMGGKQEIRNSLSLSLLL